MYIVKLMYTVFNYVYCTIYLKIIQCNQSKFTRLIYLYLIQCSSYALYSVNYTLCTVVCTLYSVHTTPGFDIFGLCILI